MSEIIFFVSLLPLLLYIPFKTKQAFSALQQNQYDYNHKYLRWIIKNPKKVFLNVDILAIFFPLLYTLIPSNILAIVFFLFYVLAILFYKMQPKEQLIKDKRVKTLTIVTILLYTVELIGIHFSYIPYLVGYYYLFIGAIIYFNYFIVMIVNIINSPIQKTVAIEENN